MRLGACRHSLSRAATANFSRRTSPSGFDGTRDGRTHDAVGVTGEAAIPQAHSPGSGNRYPTLEKATNSGFSALFTNDTTEPLVRPQSLASGRRRMHEIFMYSPSLGVIAVFANIS